MEGFLYGVNSNIYANILELQKPIEKQQLFIFSLYRCVHLHPAFVRISVYFLPAPSGKPNGVFSEPDKL